MYVSVTDVYTSILTNLTVHVTQHNAVIPIFCMIVSPLLPGKMVTMYVYMYIPVQSMMFCSLRLTS